MSQLSGVSFDSGLKKHKFGNTNIHYSADGRMMPPGDRERGYDRDNRYDYGGGGRNYRDVYRDHRRDEEDRTYRKPQPVDHRGHVGSDIRDDRPRRYGRDREWYRENNKNSDRGVDADPKNYFGDYSHPPPQRRSRKHKEPEDVLRPFGIVFVLAGILMFVCALLNILFGQMHHHYYSIWWAAFFVLEFGVLALMHKGQFDRRQKNGWTLFVGVFALLSVFVGTAFIMETLVPHFFKIIYTTNADFIASIDEADWTVKLTSLSKESHVWWMFGVDIVTLVLFVFCYAIMLALIYALNGFINISFRTTNRCEPWIDPVWFNPFGQLPMAEAIAFLGFLVKYCCLTKVPSDDIVWNKFWVPVWAAGMMAIASVVSIIAFKRPDRTVWVYSGMFLQLLAGISMGAGVTVCINGMVDNINYIDTLASGSMKEQLTVSAILYAVCATLLLPNVIYCMVIMGRLHVTGFKNRGDPYRDDKSFVTESSTPTTTLRDRVSRAYVYGHSQPYQQQYGTAPQAYNYPTYLGQQYRRY